MSSAHAVVSAPDEPNNKKPPLILIQTNEGIFLDAVLDEAFKNMGLPKDYELLGLSDLEKVLLDKTQNFIPDTPSYIFNLNNKQITLAVFDKTNSQVDALIFHIKDVGFGNFIPGSEKTPIGMLGNFSDSFFIFSPKGVENFDLNELDKISVFPKFSSFEGNLSLSSGVNFLTEVTVENLSASLQSAFNVVGIPQSVRLPIKASFGSDIFKNLKNPNLSKNIDFDLPNIALSGPSVTAPFSSYDTDFIKNIKISSKLPNGFKLPNIAPENAKFTISGTSSANFFIGFSADVFSFLDLKGTSLYLSIDPSSSAYKIKADIPEDELASISLFSGLMLGKGELFGDYKNESWEFKLEGEAELNKKAVSYFVDVKQESGKVEYVATLEGGTAGISAGDVAGRKVPGLDDLKLEKITVTNDDLIADLEYASVKGEIAAFHPQGFPSAVMAITLDKVGFSALIPGTKGTPLDGISLDKLTMMLVPENKQLLPTDQAIPSILSENINQVLADLSKSDPARKTKPIGEGVTLLAELDIKGSGGMEQLMSAAGLKETILPIGGTLSPQVFDVKLPKEQRLKGMSLSMALPNLSIPGIPSSFKMKAPIFNISDAMPPAIADLKNPNIPTAGPFTSIGMGLAMDALGKVHEFDALMLLATDVSGKQIIDLMGRAKQPKGFFSFGGLTATSLDLASVYMDKSWEFKLEGEAELNKKAVSYFVDVKQESGKVEYVATLEGGTAGISAGDVAGRKVPGLDDLKLEKITVTNDDLIADLEYASVKGEIAAFHPQGFPSAVMAITLDKVGFSALIPGTKGTPLDGISLDKLTMMLVPENKQLLPTDQAIPSILSENINQVLADLSKSDPARKTKPIGEGVTLLAELDIKGSGGMEQLMSAAGLKETILPIGGTLSPQVFDVKLPKEQRLKGMSLSMALPNLSIPGIPSSFKMKAPIFNISDAMPPAIADLKNPNIPTAGPFTSIGMGLAMDALGKVHEFDALMLLATDVSGKQIIDLMGRAKQPKGFFSFGGLTATSLDLASVYMDKSWEFKLEGEAELNKKAVSYFVDVKQESGKVEYVATLEGGTAGISAGDVAGRKVPGLDDLKLEKITVTNDDLIADLEYASVKGEIAAFHPQGFPSAVMAITLDKVGFSALIPGTKGTPLDGISLDKLTMMLVPENKQLLPTDQAIPSILSENINQVLADLSKSDPARKTKPIGEGVTLLAELDIKGSGGMEQLMSAAGLKETILPIGGTLSPQVFDVKLPKEQRLKGMSLSMALPNLSIPGIPSSFKMKAPIFNISDAMPPAIADLKNPNIPTAGPFTSIGMGLAMDALGKVHEFDALMLLATDVSGKQIIDLMGRAKQPKGFFSFGGLTATSLDLASVYMDKSWEFKLEGEAELNKKAVSYFVDVKQESGKVEYVATLEGGTAGISAGDVAGRKVPGLDDLKLEKITVTNDDLIADLEYASVKGEIAAFHPQGFPSAVMAITLDKVGFSALIPGTKGTPLDGISLDKLTMMLVPENKQLLPTDQAIPSILSENINQVLADLSKSDPARKTKPIGEGVTLLAELDIKGSGGMEQLMSAAGLKETILPIGGTLSPQVFDVKLPKEQRLKGMSLSMALPNLSIPGIPSSFKMKAPIFNISDAMPPAIADLKNPNIPTAGPFTSIGMGLAMDALGKVHEFDALMLLATDVSGKQIIDLMGRAKQPKGFFSFGGLTATSLDLASVYMDKSWEFKLEGEAELNKKAVSYFVDVKQESGKVEYVATLEGGTDGISAGDVAGRKVPGLDDLKLEKITVTNDDLIADLEYASVKGEIAAFHPQGFPSAVMAITLDKVGFSALIPGTKGTPLDGISLDKLTMMLVPEKTGTKFSLENKTIPAKIGTNVKKVLTDANKVQDFQFKGGINLFAELDLASSGDMKDLMNFIGMGSTKIIPISGVMSPKLFDNKAAPNLRYSGMDLSVPMPKISLPGMPNSFSFQAPELKITDVSPDGVEGLWTGLSAGLLGDLMGQRIQFASNIGFSDTKLSLSAVSDMQMPKPFGIDWLALQNLALGIDYDRKLKTGKFSFEGMTVAKFGKTNPKVSIELSEKEGKLSAGLLKIKDEIPFNDIPVLAGLPHAEQFAFEFFEISTDGISGGTKLHGVEIDATAFLQDKKWIFAVSDNGGGDGFKFSRLMPAVKKSPLADFHLNDAALVFAQAPIKGQVSDLPTVAQTVFTEIYGTESATINLADGITIAANFSPGNSAGNASKGLGSIGVSEDMLIEGSLQNIFGGSGIPSVSILAQIEQGPSAGGASHAPKMLSFPPEVGFFISFNPEEFEVGLQNDVVLNLPNSEALDLTSKLELGLNEKGFNIDIFLDLEGEWKEPLNIPGITLEEVALKFGISDIGEVIFGFAGASDIAGIEIGLAAEVDFLLEASGLPDGIAVKGTLDELDFGKLVTLAENMAGEGGKIDIPSTVPFPDFKNLEFAFATPGATDPDLGLNNPGLLLKGELYLGDMELGSTITEIGPNGIYINDQVADIELEGIKLDGNEITIDVSTTKLPEFKIDTNIDFYGVKQAAEIKFDGGIYEVEISQKIEGLFEADYTFAYGFDVGKSGMPTVYLAADVKEGFDQWVMAQVPAKIESFFEILQSGYDQALERIKKAEEKVRGIKGKIQARKAAIQRQRNRADRAINAAIQQVDRLRANKSRDCGNASHDWNRCKRLRGLTGSCRGAARNGWLCGVQDTAAVAVGEAVLKAAKSVEDHLPTDLDPQLVALRSEYSIAMGVLHTAELAIGGLEDMDKWMSSGLKTLTDKAKAKNSAKMSEIFMEADLGDIVNGAPLLLSLDLVILGKDLGRQTFAFKLDDPKFDVLQLSYVPLHLIHELFKNDVPKGLSKMLAPVLDKIVAEIKTVEDQAHKAAKKANNMLEKDLDQMRGNIASDIQASYGSNS